MDSNDEITKTVDDITKELDNLQATEEKIPDQKEDLKGHGIDMMEDFDDPDDVIEW